MPAISAGRSAGGHKNLHEGHSSSIILEGGLCVYLLVDMLMLLFIYLHGGTLPKP